MKKQLLNKIERLQIASEYIENVNEVLNRLFVRACKASGYFEVNEVENELKKVVEINGLEII